MKAIIVGLLLGASLSLYAKTGKLKDLRPGEILRGTDEVSKESCSLEILQNDGESINGVVAVGPVTYRSSVLIKKGSLSSELYINEILRERTDHTRIVEGLLRQKKLSGVRSFLMRETLIYGGGFSEGQYFRTNDLINCKFN